jgi:hypothetical protein
VVRSCPSPVGRAQIFPKRSNNFLVLGVPASLIGSEFPHSPTVRGSDSSLCPAPMP